MNLEQNYKTSDKTTRSQYKKDNPKSNYYRVMELLSLHTVFSVNTV